MLSLLTSPPPLKQPEEMVTDHSSETLALYSKKNYFKIQLYVSLDTPKKISISSFFYLTVTIFFVNKRFIHIDLIITVFFVPS